MNIIDHVALTVPDIEEATEFFEKVFDAQLALIGLSKRDAPYAGPEAELLFAMPHGGRVTDRRVLTFSSGANIELFEFAKTPHQRPAHTYDYGLQHFTVRVDDLQQTAKKFIEAGGDICQSEGYRQEVLNNTSPTDGWLYGKTPWGSMIEMVTFKEV